MRLAKWPERGEGNLYDIATRMRGEYERAGEDLKDRMATSESAMIFVKQLARALRLSAARGKEADKAMGLRKIGRSVYWDNPSDVRKKRRGPDVPMAFPTDPTIRKTAGSPPAEAEADKAAARAKRFKGTPKFRGEERPMPPVERLPGGVVAPEVPSGGYRREEERAKEMLGDDPAGERRRQQDKLISMLRPAARSEYLKKFKKEGREFDSYLTRMFEHSLADYIPTWLDDL
jgi:hypothetical protein